MQTNVECDRDYSYCYRAVDPDRGTLVSSIPNINLNPATNGEPVLTSGAIAAAISALMDAAISFGLPLSAHQELSVIGTVNPVLIVLAVVLARSHVKPLIKLDPADPDSTAPGPVITGPTLVK